MRYLFIFIFILSTQLFSLELCKTNKTLCSNIERNKYIIATSKDNKEKLNSIAFISKRVGLLSHKDNLEIINFLSLTYTYRSIFTMDDVFVTLASKCGNKIYIVEASFDKNYNINFTDRKVSKIEEYPNGFLINNKPFLLSATNELAYNMAFIGLVTPPPPPIVYEDIEEEYLCVTNSVRTSLNLRDPNDYSKVLVSLKARDKVKVISKTPMKSSKGQLSHYVKFENYSGYVSITFLDKCENVNAVQ